MDSEEPKPRHAQFQRYISPVLAQRWVTVRMVKKKCASDPGLIIPTDIIQEEETYSTYQHRVHELP